MIKAGVFALLFLLSGSAYAEVGIASYYGLEACKYNPSPSCPTASGLSLKTLIKDKIPYVAMYGPKFEARVTIKGPLGVAEGLVLDRGPNKRLGRIIDLSEGLFKQVCGDLKQGTCKVEVTHA